MSDVGAHVGSDCWPWVATPKLTAMITIGPRTAISSPRPLGGLNSDRRPHDASLTARDDQADGECDRHHRHGNADQRCNAGMRQRERDGEPERVRDGEETTT
jgi:hypothetical protein